MMVFRSPMLEPSKHSTKQMTSESFSLITPSESILVLMMSWKSTFLTHGADNNTGLMMSYLSILFCVEGPNKTVSSGFNSTPSMTLCLCQERRCLWVTAMTLVSVPPSTQMKCGITEIQRKFFSLCRAVYLDSERWWWL